MNTNEGIHNNRIAIITTHSIQYYAPLFKRLSERGVVDVKVFYTWSQTQEKKYDPDFKKEVSWDLPLLEGYEYTFVENVSRNPGSRHFRGIDNPSLIEEITTWKPDAILVFGWAFKSHLKVLRHFKGKVPVYFRGDSNLLDEQKGLSIKKTLRKLFLTWVYSHIDKAFYVGQANKAYYLKYGLAKDMLVHAPHAIDNERFSNAGDNAMVIKREQWRAAKAIAPTDMVFLFVGKFIAKKDPLTLLKAFTECAINDSWLLFVGNGELEEELREDAKGTHNVFFVDFQNQSEMPLMYNIADVFVLPSVGPGETWGLAVNEAMACSKPVIVSDRCGCAADLVQEGRNGFTFKAGNVESLKAAMKKFRMNDAKLAEMGKASFYIVQDFSFDTICSSIEGTIDKEITNTKKLSS